jgi:hypothetical protein
MVSSMTTESDGRFHFEDLAAGKYTLSAGKYGYPHQLFQEHEGFSTAVAVGPGVASDPIVFPLHADAAISGRVTDEHGDPVVGAQVWLLRAGGGPSFVQAQTDDRGLYKIRHQPPGDYVIAVSAQPWYTQGSWHTQDSWYGHDAAPRRAGQDGVSTEAWPLDMAFPLTFYGGATNPARAATIALSWGLSVTADVVLDAVPAVHLHVHTPAADSPATEARGTIAFEGPPTTNGGQGGFGVMLTHHVFGAEIPALGYSVNAKPGITEVSGLPPGTYSMAMQGNGEKPVTLRKEIDTSAGPDVDAASGLKSVEVSGTADLDGAKIPENPGAVIRLRSMETKQWLMAPVTDGNKFEFPQGVLPGKYELDVNGVDLFLQSQECTGARVAGSTIEVGAEPVTLRLSLSHGLGQVDGVALRDGKPQGGAHVLLVPENRSETLFRRDQSDSDGTFTLAAVPQGNYIAIAIKDWDVDWRDASALRPYLAHGVPVKVEAGGKYKVEVEIQ